MRPYHISKAFPELFSTPTIFNYWADKIIGIRGVRDYNKEEVRQVIHVRVDLIQANKCAQIREFLKKGLFTKREIIESLSASNVRECNVNKAIEELKRKDMLIVDERAWPKRYGIK